MDYDDVSKGSPRQPRPARKTKNELGQWAEVSQELLAQLLGSEWRRAEAKAMRTFTLSGDNFQLESLDGLLNPSLRIQHIQVLNISNNLLPNLKVLSTRNAQGENRFESLATIKASKNFLTHVHISIDTLTAINLSGNQLTKLPQFSTKRLMRRILLSHNRINIGLEGPGNMEELHNMRHLQHLDLSYNQISWKPSKFKECISSLSALHVEVLLLGCNPFTEHFHQYQFLAVCMLETITHLDGFHITSELRSDMKVFYDKLVRDGRLDLQEMDIRVSDLKAKNVPMAAPKGDLDALTYMPLLEDLFDSMLECLDQAVDDAYDFGKHLNMFNTYVRCLWDVKWHKRIRFMTTHGSKDPNEEVKKREALKNKRKICHFVDKIHTIVTKYDSMLGDIITSLARLLACGNPGLSQACAKILRETIEESTILPFEVFHELRERVALGTVSVQEDGPAVYETQRLGAESSWGSMSGFAIEESTAILESLVHLGSTATWVRNGNPRCSRLLRPFLQFICGATREEKGDLLPNTGTWLQYTDFDSMPDETVEVIEGADPSYLEIVSKTVVQRGYGGFVTEDMGGHFTVFIKGNSPQLLVAARVPRQGRVLHVRPVTPEAPVEQLAECKVFDNYCAGLAVLSLATEDPVNAAQCIQKYSLHEISLFDDSAKSNKIWLTNVTSLVLVRTVIRLLRIQINLLSAAGDAKITAAQTFVKHNLHKSVWQAMQLRLTDNGVGLALSVLKHLPQDTKVLLSWSLVLQCALADPELGVQDQLMEFMVSSGQFVYDLLLRVVGDPGTPEPLLFATSLEVIYMLLDHDTTRPIFIESTLIALHHSMVLLPYIKGPELEDGSANVNFNAIYAECQRLYFGETHGEEEAEKHHEHHVAVGVSAPQMRELTNTMMHRVLLGIVRLIQLFSSSKDPELMSISYKLNKIGREKLLLGPSSGLINCPDWDVKIQSLKCVEHVTETSPEDLERQEMSWLMRYLSPHGIGVGKQEDVLTEVLNLCITLVGNAFIAGHRFRDNFAKQAIRVSFQILRDNCERDVSSSPEEEASKVALSLKICHLLQACGEPHLSGNLRPYLREEEFEKNLIQVIVAEDGHDRNSCRAALLTTWTGRNMNDVLLPLACSNIVSLNGHGRLRALERIPDAIWGTRDQVHSRSRKETQSWPGPAAVEKDRRMMDEVQRQDWLLQQETFVSSDGVGQLLDYVVKLCSQFGEQKHLTAACALLQEIEHEAEHKVHAWFHSAAHHSSELGTKHVAASSKLTSQTSEPPSLSSKSQANEVLEMITTQFHLRLESTNIMVMEEFHVSLSVFDQETQRSSLEKLAEVFAQHFQENQELGMKVYESDTSFWGRLLSDDKDSGVPDMMSEEGILCTTEELTAKGVTMKIIRQPVGDLDTLYSYCELAHLKLKRSLVRQTKVGKDYEKAMAWAEATFVQGRHGQDRRVSKCLVDFIESHDGEVYDPGLKDRAIVMRHREYKYNGDFTRVRNISRLVIEFKKTSDLIEALQGLMKFTLFTAVKIKNRYRKPTGLGRRLVIVLVEVATEVATVVCTIMMVVSTPDADVEQRRAEFTRKVREVVAKDCNVQDNPVEVADYVTYLINSRAVRSGDKVHIMMSPTNLSAQVVGTDLHLPDVQTQSPAQIFTLEPKNGPGVVHIGDTVFLKSHYTDKYLDSSLSGAVSCRHEDRNTDLSNLAWRVEALDQHEEDSGGTINLLSNINTIFKNDASNEKAAAASKNRIKRLFGRPLQSSHIVTLRALGTERFLGAHTDGHEPNRLRAVKIKWLEKGYSRRLRLQRHGNFRAFLNDETFSYMSSRSGKEDGAAQEAPEVKLKQLLNEAMMHGDLSRIAPRCFLFPAVNFKVLSQKMADYEWPDPDSSKQFFFMTRMASYLKAIYGLLCVAVDYDFKAALLDDFLGDPMHGAAPGSLSLLTRFLSAALTTMSYRIEVRKPLVGADVELLAAWMPQKLLMVLSGFLLHMPAESKTATAGPENIGRAAQRKIASSEASGVTDMHSLMFVVVVVDFVRRAFIGPLMERLAVVSHRPLNVREIALLRQCCVFFGHVCHRFSAIELRRQAHEEGSALTSAMDAIENMTHMPHMSHMSWSTTPACSLSDAERGKIFEEMAGRESFQILVHGLMYGIHREAMNYSSPKSDGETVVEVDRTHLKLVTALVNHALHSLTECMKIVRPHDPMDYDVAEAVSAALASSTQSVPRARIEELMQQRDFAKFETAAQVHISNGLCNQISCPATGALRGEAKGERVMFSALVHMGWCSACKAPEWTRRLLVVTSRMALVFFDIPPEMIDQRDDEEAIPPSCLKVARDPCNIHRIDRVILSPKIRQMLIFWWDQDNELAQTNREVVIFRSPAKRTRFREVMLIGQPFMKKRVAVDGKKPPRPKGVSKWDRGIIEAPVSVTSMLAVQWFVKRVRPRNEAKLVTISFCTYRGELEALVLTSDMIACFSAAELFQHAFCSPDDAEMYSRFNFEGEGLLDHQDSDSDVEEPELLELAGSSYSTEITVSSLRGSLPWTLDTLKGVWFMASNMIEGKSAPQMKLQFTGSSEDIFVFLSDSDRQRFRQKLAKVMESQSKTLSFVPTKAENLNDANKTLQARTKRDANRLKEIAKLSKEAKIESL